MLQPSPIYIGKTINKQYFVESKNDYISRGKYNFILLDLQISIKINKFCYIIISLSYYLFQVSKHLTSFHEINDFQ